MSRPVVLVFLLLTFIVTSQFEWRRQLMEELDPGLGAAEKQQHSVKDEEAAREKIILLQEKSIQRLTLLAQSLRQQLLQCRAANGSGPDAAAGDPLAKRPSQIEEDGVPQEIL